MTIYQVVQIRDNVSINIIAAYTKLEEAEKELKWRLQTAGPSMYDYRKSFFECLEDFKISPHPYRHGPRDDYRILETQLITDKFTQFALEGNPYDTN